MDHNNYKSFTSPRHSNSTKNPSIHRSSSYNKKKSNNNNNENNNSNNNYYNNHSTNNQSIDNNNNINHNKYRRRKNMNNLAPRFQQRAFYSQFHQSDYEPLWRANAIANSNYKLPLGKRPEPEGAPSNTPQLMNHSFYNNNVAPSNSTNTNNYVLINQSELSNSKKQHHNQPVGNPSVTYGQVVFDRVDLFSDYGSETETSSSIQETNSNGDVSNRLDPSWNTATILSHAYKIASECNKRTALSYAVIGAELHSLARVHSDRTQVELSKVSSRANELAGDIDRARAGLKDIALGLRDIKETAKKEQVPTNRKKSKKHSLPTTQYHPATSNLNSSQSDVSTMSEDLESRRYTMNMNSTDLPYVYSTNSIPEHHNLHSYCTLVRKKSSKKHRHHPEKISSSQNSSYAVCMNLESPYKISSKNHLNQS